MVVVVAGTEQGQPHPRVLTPLEAAPLLFPTMPPGQGEVQGVQGGLV